jgi:hypothetical protein
MLKGLGAADGSHDHPSVRRGFSRISPEITEQGILCTKLIISRVKPAFLLQFTVAVCLAFSGIFALGKYHKSKQVEQPMSRMPFWPNTAALI